MFVEDGRQGSCLHESESFFQTMSKRAAVPLVLEQPFAVTDGFAVTTITAALGNW